MSTLTLSSLCTLESLMSPVHVVRFTQFGAGERMITTCIERKTSTVKDFSATTRISHSALITRSFDIQRRNPR